MSDEISDEMCVYEEVETPEIAGEHPAHLKKVKWWTKEADGSVHLIADYELQGEHMGYELSQFMSFRDGKGKPVTKTAFILKAFLRAFGVVLEKGAAIDRNKPFSDLYGRDCILTVEMNEYRGERSPRIKSVKAAT